MPDEVLQNIFRPFFTTKGEQGTGLGVPQVGAFMRRIGGHTRVASVVGQGTKFDLFFPAAEPNGTRRPCGTDVGRAPPYALGGQTNFKPNIFNDEV
jgi:K+-sensing histidine kinase KdpD